MIQIISQQMINFILKKKELLDNSSFFLRFFVFVDEKPCCKARGISLLSVTRNEGDMPRIVGLIEGFTKG